MSYSLTLTSNEQVVIISVPAISIGIVQCEVRCVGLLSPRVQSYLDFGLWPTADTALKINMDNILANFTI